MEFLRASRRKNIFSEMLYVGLNIVLAAVLFLLVTISGQVEAALVLVLLSKWRVLAVRMRYWYANIAANLVDVTVGLSTVGLLYLAGTASEGYVVGLQAAIALFYALWLTAIKPRSSAKAMYAQASIGIFMGTWVLAAFAHVLSLPVVVALYYVLGYGVAYHILAIYKEQQASLLAMVFGLVLAELGWVAYHWTAAYGLNQAGDLKIPQIALVATLMTLFAERCYGAFVEGHSIKQPEYLAPIIFSVAGVVALVVFFSSIGSGIV